MHVIWRWEHWCHLFWQGVWLLWGEVCAGFCLNSHFSAVFTVYSREIGCRCGRHCMICTVQLSVHNAQHLVRGPLSGSYSTAVGENALVCSRYSIYFKKYRAELFQNVIWELFCMLLKWQTLCRAHKHAYYSTLTFTLVMLTCMKKYWHHHCCSTLYVHFLLSCSDGAHAPMVAQPMLSHCSRQALKFKPGAWVFIVTPIFCLTNSTVQVYCNLDIQTQMRFERASLNTCHGS